jgi:Na+/proline symporter
MNSLDFAVMLATLLAIVLYGTLVSRGQKDFQGYFQGGRSLKWGTIGLSVMATQASAITFLSTPGLGYESGMRFVQNYLGLPLAIVIICAFFLPIYRRQNVYTAYEYLGQRFDAKSRYLGAMLFLTQRGLAAGITLYAPAIIISTVLGWDLNLTILAGGVMVIIYTISGGTKAVSLTQKWQMAIILTGMAVAFFVLVSKISQHASVSEALHFAGAMGKLQAIDFSINPDERYTFWSGILGGTFLALSYFGTDQSQVQRYLSGHSLTESKMGLLFNAVVKIPMQFFILLTGVFVFVFYQFEQPPIHFKAAEWGRLASGPYASEARALETAHQQNFQVKRGAIEQWQAASQSGDKAKAEAALSQARQAEEENQKLLKSSKDLLQRSDPSVETNDTDYVFITWVLHHLPHGMIGLLVAVIFCAAMSSTASELDALATTTVIDLYKPLLKPEGSDQHYIKVSKWLTAGWGSVALSFALMAYLVENLIEAVNILGSLFYGVILGLFLVAFFLKKVGGTAVFWAGIIAQATVILLFTTTSIGYLWYNIIGCALTVTFSLILQRSLPR